MNMGVVWGVTSRNLLELYRRFGRTYLFLYSGDRQYLPSLETSVNFCQTTRRHM